MKHLLPLLFMAACTITTTSPGTPGNPNPGSGSDGGTPNDSDDPHGCSKACAAYMKPACSSQTLSDCLGTCNAKAAKCPTQADATNACIPTTGVHCDSDGLAESDGCDAEFKALGACVSGAHDAGQTSPSCVPHRAPNDDAKSCTGDCPQPTYISTGGTTYVWCTVKCTSDATCDAASGKPGVYGCDGTVCLARCTDDCSNISGASGCGGGFCY
jgi:hypothetical protein